MEMKRALPYLLLLVACAIAYCGVFNHEFLLDDEFLIVKNTFLRSWEHLPAIFATSSTGGALGTDSFYRPVQGVLYLLVFQLVGLSTVGFHTLNLLLHFITACLAWILGRRLGFEARWCWVAVLLWILHPIHTEAITFMSATADSSHTLFILLGLICLLPDFSAWRTVGACVCFLLALLSKEAAIVFPGLAVVCLWFTLAPAERWRWRSYLCTWPFWVIAVGYAIARKTFLNFDGTFDFYKTSNIYTEHILYRVFTCLATLPSYLGLLLWPAHLSMERDFPVFVSPSLPVLLGIAILLAIIVLCWRTHGRLRATLIWTFLWFFVAHSIDTGILLPINSLFLEHWMYLPSIGLFIGGAEALHLTIGERRWSSRWLVPLAAAAALALAVRTIRQNETWRDPITFYTHILDYYPRAARDHNNIAMAYAERGQIDEALKHYQTAIELSDTYPQTQYNLARLLAQTGKIPEAVEHLERCLQLNRNFFQAYQLLAQIYAAQGDMQKRDDYANKADAIIKQLIH